MKANSATQAKSESSKNISVIACGLLLAVYCICITGAFAGIFWGLGSEEQATEANATQTVVAQTTEQNQFELIDHFDDNSRHWRVGEFKNNGHWEGSMEIKDGVYTLKVDRVQEPFFQPTDLFTETPIKDFDVYVDTKFINGTSANICGGIDFHRSFKGWWQGVYTFLICQDSSFMIAYVGDNGWDVISGRHFSNAILLSEWNRLAISARGNHFNFTINNQSVYQMTDVRQEEGALGISIEFGEKKPATVLFDNFGYQSH